MTKSICIFHESRADASRVERLNEWVRLSRCCGAFQLRILFVLLGFVLYVWGEEEWQDSPAVSNQHYPSS